MWIPTTKHWISYKKSNGTIVPIKRSSTSSLYDIRSCGDREAFRRQFKQQAASPSTYVDYSGEYTVYSGNEYWIEWYDIFGKNSQTNNLTIIDGITGETTVLLNPEDLFSDTSSTYTQYDTMYLYIYWHDFHLAEVYSSVYITICFVGFKIADDDSLTNNLNTSYRYDCFNPYDYPKTNPIKDIKIVFDTEAGWSKYITIQSGVDSSDAQLEIWRKKI